MMTQDKIKAIKEDAIYRHIPIIMDDTLNEISKILEKKNIQKILEIGTAVRLFCNMFF